MFSGSQTLNPEDTKERVHRTAGLNRLIWCRCSIASKIGLLLASINLFPFNIHRLQFICACLSYLVVFGPRVFHQPFQRLSRQNLYRKVGILGAPKGYEHRRICRKLRALACILYEESASRVRNASLSIHWMYRRYVDMETRRRANLLLS